MHLSWFSWFPRSKLFLHRSSKEWVFFLLVNCLWSTRNEMILLFLFPDLPWGLSRELYKTWSFC
jgi:hypothetical protein